MDYDTLYGGLRWNIIERIAQSAKSPLELSKEISTSIANISMHLRVLEAAGVVTKQRISNSKAGEPRILYTLSQDILFLAFACSDLQVKNQFELTADKKAIMHIWQLPKEVQGPVCAFYFSYAFPQTYNLYYESMQEKTIKLTLCTEKTDRITSTHTVTHASMTYTIELTTLSLFEVNTTTLRLLYRGFRGEQ
jgi:DNA-binding transcriptional ArsR family regulator